MKNRTPAERARTERGGSEFKGVIKKITGKLTGRRELEEQGRAEMLGGEGAQPGAPERSSPETPPDPDPHRRG
jgi:uncharacterized protein YjbJ (UPF0337 family)